MDLSMLVCLPVPKDHKVLQARKDQQERKGQWVHKDHKVLPEQLDHRALKAPRVFKVHKGPRVSKVLKVLKELPERL
jgi:hypothetical protein